MERTARRTSPLLHSKHKIVWRALTGTCNTFQTRAWKSDETRAWKSDVANMLMFQVLFRQVVCAESTVWFSALRASSRIIRSLIQTHAELVNTSLRPSCVDVVRQGSSEIHHHINKHSSKTHHHINKLNFSFCWSSSRPPSFCNVGGSLLDRSEKKSLAGDHINIASWGRGWGWVSGQDWS